MEISAKDLPEAIIKILRAGKTPNILGSPGVGKSDIVKKVAKDLNLKVIDFRLSQADPTDLNGFPSIVDNRSTFVPSKVFPLEGDTIPKGYDGWLLFLDEANSAPPSVQVAAYKLILDRAIGQFNLHKHTAIVTAGNLSTDKAIVTRTSTAMQSRLIHLNLMVSTKDWLSWAYENKIDYRITSYIEFQPDMLHKFDPNHKDNTFPSPRTWNFASDIIKDADITPLDLVILAGTVGEGAARLFKSFLDVYEELPKYEQIYANPSEVKFKNSPDMLYALSGLVANNITEDNIERLSKFINRLEPDFQVITYITAIKRNNKIISCAFMKKWITDNSEVLID